MSFEEVMQELERLGSEQTRKTWMRHGAKGPIFGVKIGDMKNIQKKIRHNHELALQLFDTGNGDVMYFAALISEPLRMTKAQLNDWAYKAPWYMVSEYAVPWTAAMSNYGRELALEWMDSDDELVESSGWSTYASLLSVKPGNELDLAGIERLLERVVTEIHTAKNRVRYHMNHFVIAVGSYVPELTDKAMAAGAKIGKVDVYLGDTSCKVPSSPEYIQKVVDAGKVGAKRKTAFC